MGFDVQKSYEELLKIKSLPPDKFKDWKEKKRWDIVKYHFNNNSYYRSKFLKKSLDTWEKLPVLHKKICKAIWIFCYHLHINQKMFM